MLTKARTHPSGLSCLGQEAGVCFGSRTTQNGLKTSERVCRSYSWFSATGHGDTKNRDQGSKVRVEKKCSVVMNFCSSCMDLHHGGVTED